MSHDLLIDETGKAKFLDTRGPAWHRMGTIRSGETLKAVEAVKDLGLWELTLEPLQTLSGLPLTQRAIVRTGVDLQPKVLNVVSEGYTLINPEQFCAIFDAKVGAPVETLGALKDGGLMFTTTKMPTVDIAGDEVVPYFAAVNGMNGVNAVSLMVTHQRIVCQNTLMAAESAASETVRLRHGATVVSQLEAWMEHMYQSAAERAATVEATFRRLTEVKASKAHVKAVLAAAYPMPKAPALDMPPTLAEAAQRQYEQLVERRKTRYAMVEQLYLGAGTGSETPAAAGTLWGLWNAVVEAEDYRNGGDPATLAESAVFGNRARNKQRAYVAAVKLAK